VIAFALAAGSFVAMEAVSYSAHRWLMHGPGMGWHRSHHRPPRGRLERNDLFPVCFATLGVACFAVAAAGPNWSAARWIGVGVTVYGAAYLLVHEVVIHHRLPLPVPTGRYLRWLAHSHALHHRFGGEPYGMLLPVVPSTLRREGAEVGDAGALDRRMRATRARL
jgi:beta-carotene 3-hydroxylase